MKRKNWSMKLSAALAGALLVLAGCQPVSSVDVNKVLNGSFAVKSGEGRSTVAFELTPDGSATTTAEQKKALELFGKIKLDITEAKTQDALHASLKGTLEYSKGKIPFHLEVSEMDYIVWLEGAKKPIVFKNNPAAFPQGAAGEVGLSVQLQKQIEDLAKKAVEKSPELGSFFVNNFPNPNKITAGPVTETVYGESLSLTKVHAELYGSELVSIVKGFLTNVLADDAGLKAFIGTLYDLYAPLVKAVVEEQSKSGGSDEMNAAIAPYLNNKTLAVEFLHTYIKSTLQKAVDQYDQTAASLTTSPTGEGLKPLLSDQHWFKVDLWVDKDYLPRKSAMEWNLTLSEGKGDGIKGIKVTSTSENWNVNKPVTVSKVDVSKGVTEWEPSSRFTAGRLLAALEPNSTLYKLLKDDLHVTHKNIRLNAAEAGEVYGTQPYNDNGTVMVPVRFVTEQLDADVKWNAEAKKVTITDPLSGSIIELTIGSNQATVGGKTLTLEKPAQLVNSATYVPVRIVSEGMGADVKWEQDTQSVVITRE
ncbi:MULTISPECIES: copper amine oxidase N-terminal domain-containing protein [Paenibacillus]|uniref:copper amine oxidase N-terminal domain-containing protein n=1 Tax=Paenibacillus TaxID=44249 RepID=UPI0022B87C3B|nr:copper amine oxidase N-terminal domain-containing protein [Paenibacillus caseinilyticus]MCZ8522367.1 copper amine oxidase N-terminal domain-containing protein [Paenibacillus caseinilyticus]